MDEMTISLLILIISTTDNSPGLEIQRCSFFSFHHHHHSLDFLFPDSTAPKYGLRHHAYMHAGKQASHHHEEGPEAFFWRQPPELQVQPELRACELLMLYSWRQGLPSPSRFGGTAELRSRGREMLQPRGDITPSPLAGPRSKPCCLTRRRCWLAESSIQSMPKSSLSCEKARQESECESTIAALRNITDLNIDD